MVGLLAGHFSAFLFLFPVGLRRLLSSSSLYLSNPSLFRSKTWYLSEPRWRNLDLYALLVALPIAAFSDLFLFLSLSLPSPRFAFLHQSALTSLFWLLVLLVLARHSLDPFLVDDSFVFAFAGASFLLDCSLTGGGGAGAVGSPVSSSSVSAVAYGLIADVTLVCAASCFYLAARPAAFFAEFVLCSGMILKATWTLQAGLTLYSDAFSLKGCRKIDISPAKSAAAAAADGSSGCDLEEDSLRGVALINFLFIGHAIVVLIVCFVFFGLLSRNGAHLRSGEGAGPLLAQLESGSSSVQLQQPQIFELE